MCRVAGLRGTPGSWRSGSGREKLGGRQEGKEGQGRGVETDLERQRDTYIERGTDREMGREKQGNREPERDRQSNALGDYLVGSFKHFVETASVVWSMLWYAFQYALV